MKRLLVIFEYYTHNVFAATKCYSLLTMHFLHANAFVNTLEKSHCKVKHFLFSFLVLHAYDFLLYYSGNNE